MACTAYLPVVPETGLPTKQLGCRQIVLRHRLTQKAWNIAHLRQAELSLQRSALALAIFVVLEQQESLSDGVAVPLFCVQIRVESDCQR